MIYFFSQRKEVLVSLLKDRLLYLRENAGFSQKEVGTLLKLSRTTYSNYENGNREPSMQILKNIAALYNVPIAYLTGDISLVYNDMQQEYHVSDFRLNKLSKLEITLLHDFRLLTDTQKEELISILQKLKDSSS